MDRKYLFEAMDTRQDAPVQEGLEEKLEWTEDVIRKEIEGVIHTVRHEDINHRTEILRLLSKVRDLLQVEK